MKKVLTIIVSYNFMRWIDRCLPSLQDSTYPTDILVIDNGSTDDTIKLLQNNYPSVRLIANHKNLGFGQANNIGMKIALQENYDAVFLLNQDAWVDKTTIARLVEVSTSHPEYGILSPIHLTGDHNQPEHGFSIYTGVNDLQHLSDSEVVSVPFINAAVWYIPIEVLKRVGLFAPLFYHYGEDKDYANRIHYYKYLIGYLPDIFACHDRAFRIVKRTDFVRAERVYHLSEYANVNYSFGKAFSYGILALWKKATISLLHGRLDNWRLYTKLSVILLNQTNKVKVTRKLSIQNNQAMKENNHE